jgi:hypothetical protein
MVIRRTRRSGAALLIPGLVLFALWRKWPATKVGA